MSATVKHISYYIPPSSLSNEKLNKEFPEWSVEKISSKTGIYNRGIAEGNETSSDLAYKAAERLFEEHSVNREDIDFVMLCTQSPDYFLPTTACLLQERLGLSQNCGAFDYNLGCSGYVYGLAIAKGLVNTGIAKNLLLITAETYSKFINPKDKKNRTIFGDAAAATLITNEGTGGSIQEFVLGTDGRGAKNLIVKNGGMRNRNGDANIVTDEFNNTFSDDDLFMNGQEIFIFTLKAIPKMIKSVMKKHELEMSDIDLFIFHQANGFMLEHLRKKLKIDKDKFFIFLENCGNTVSSTIPIALAEAKKAGKIGKGNKVLLAGFGVGYSWGATILEF
jgi:3-oxoacyl-[acyl-carrier-protein] synthase-3